MARLLLLEEEAVLKAIFDQRAKSRWSPIFEYDFDEAQRYLHSIGAFSKCDLDRGKQYDVINRLTDEGIIQTDYIVDAEFTNNYRIATHSERALIESDERYFWVRNTEWAREHFGPDERTSIEEVGEKYCGVIFINMSTADMRRIETQYMASRTVHLILVVDGDDCILRIKFGKEDWHEIYRMNKDKKTSKILRAAFKNAGKEVETEYEYLKSRVFRKNGPVRALNPTLIKLDGNKITFKTSARVTPAEYVRLKEALGIA